MAENWATFVHNFNECSQYSMNVFVSQTFGLNEILSRFILFMTKIFHLMKISFRLKFNQAAIVPNCLHKSGTPSRLILAKNLLNIVTLVASPICHSKLVQFCHLEVQKRKYFMGFTVNKLFTYLTSSHYVKFCSSYIYLSSCLSVCLSESSERPGR